MGAIVSQITTLTIVYPTVFSDADQRKHQRSVSLAFVWGIHRGPVNSPHKWPVTRKMFPFDDVIMTYASVNCIIHISGIGLSLSRHQVITRTNIVNGSIRKEIGEIRTKIQVFIFKTVHLRM